MFIRKSQTEERQYQEGRRDGFYGDVMRARQAREPAYAAGVRVGMTESLMTGESRTCSTES